MNGKIVRKTDNRGFGFIKSGDKEFFFHLSGCLTNFDDLHEGDNITFDEEYSPKGPRAKNIRLMD